MHKHPAFGLDWNLVRTFTAVAHSGSLAAGAGRIGITHPTAARHIQQLESHLGMGLFTRTGKGLKLNDAGRRLEHIAQSMHDHALDFESQSDALRAAPVTTVRISVAEMFAELMPDVLFDGFGEANCGAVEMLVSNDLANLLQRDADMAIRHVAPAQQELLCRRVGCLTMGAYANDDYLQQYGDLSQQTLAQHKFVDGLSQNYLVKGAQSRGFCIEPEQIIFRSDSVAAQRAAVCAGCGIGVFPTWMAATEPTWLSVFPVTEVIDLQVWLVARPEVRDNTQLRAMFTCLGDALVQRLQTYAD